MSGALLREVPLDRRAHRTVNLPQQVAVEEDTAADRGAMKCALVRTTPAHVPKASRKRRV